jgi:hypothetical protein
VCAQAETLATLLGHTQFGADPLARCGGGGFVLLASALVLPTVLLPDLEALAALGAAGVAAAVTVGGVVSALRRAACTSPWWLQPACRE